MCVCVCVCQRVCSSCRDSKKQARTAEQSSRPSQPNLSVSVVGWSVQCVSQCVRVCVVCLQQATSSGPQPATKHQMTKRDKVHTHTHTRARTPHTHPCTRTHHTHTHTHTRAHTHMLCLLFLSAEQAETSKAAKVLGTGRGGKED